MSRTASVRKRTDTFSIVSLEGNWDAATNAQRLDLAAAAFDRSNADFIISSGTYEPGASVETCARPKKLGERNAETLCNIRGIDPALVIPAYTFPFEFTYTTIEAFGNACAIGWLMSGFERRADPGYVNFAPISSGVHCRRVYILNVRACQALVQFNVDTTVKRQTPLSPNEPSMVESEERKLHELTRLDGALATGRWLHGNAVMSFDDPGLMRATMAGMIKATFPGLEKEEAGRIGAVQSTAQRYAILQMLCEASGRKVLGSRALDGIFERAAQRFEGAFDETYARQIAERLAKAIC